METIITFNGKRLHVVDSFDLKPFTENAVEKMEFNKQVDVWFGNTLAELFDNIDCDNADTFLGTVKKDDDIFFETRLEIARFIAW